MAGEFRDCAGCTYRGVPLAKYLDERFASLERATSLAQDNINTRLVSMNEWRAAMSDQAARFATKDALEQERCRIDDKLKPMTDALAEARGRASQNSVNVAYAMSAIGLLIGVASLLVAILGRGG